MTLSVYSRIVSDYRPHKAGWTFPVDQTFCHQIPTSLFSLMFLMPVVLCPCMHTVPLSYLCSLKHVWCNAINTTREILFTPRNKLYLQSGTEASLTFVGQQFSHLLYDLLFIVGISQCGTALL